MEERAEARGGGGVGTEAVEGRGKGVEARGGRKGEGGWRGSMPGGDGEVRGGVKDWGEGGECSR